MNSLRPSLRCAPLVFLATCYLALATSLLSQTPSRGLTANPTTGALLWPDAATFATANSLSTTTGLNAFAADPSTNGSFSASAWRADLSVDNVDNTSDANKPISTATQTALNLKQSVGPGLSSLSLPLIIAHRGGSVPSPEHCMAGYRLMAKYPTILLEADVVVLGDGTQGIMHDSTVERTTLGTGSNTQYDAALWRSLRMKTASANGSGTIYNVPTDTGPAMFDEFLSEFGNKRVLVVEVKTSGAGDLMRDTLLDHGITPDHVIVTAANDAALQPSRLAGYKTMYAVGSGVSAASVAALGHEWVALAASAVDEARVDEFHAQGIKVAIYTVESHYLADRYIGYGVDAIFSDDPIWIARQTATRSTDPFFSLGRTHGSQDRAVSVDNTRYYLPTGKLFLGRSGNYTGQLQGWAYPLPTSAEITFSADFITSGSGTNAVGVFVGNTDFPFTSANSGTGDYAVLPEGYTLYLNKTGALTITKRTGISANSVTLGSQSGTAITDGTTVQIRVRITATDLTIERLDVPTSLTVTNSDYRPLPYLQFGTLSIQAAFHTATVSTYVP